MIPTGHAPASICYVTTTSVTLSAFVVESATFLAEEGGFGISMAAAEDIEFAESLPKTISYHAVPMSRGIDPGAPRAIWSLVKLFRHEHFDLVQFSTPNAALYAAVAAFVARVPVRVYAQWGIRYVGFRGFRRKIFKAVEKITCLLATHVEPDSHGNLEFAVAQGLYPRRKGHVIWQGSACGVDLARFDISRAAAWRLEVREELGLGKDDFVFGFVGRLSRDKGGDELLTAARTYFRGDQSARLLVVGGLESLGMDPELMDWMQREPRVVLCGPTRAVARYLAAMDVLVHPSYREGFGLVIAEAQAMGLPAIVTAIPGPLDAVIPNETAIVIPPRDPSALRRALGALAADDGLRSRMGIAAHEWSRNNFDSRIFRRHLLERRIGQLSAAERRGK